MLGIEAANAMMCWPVPLAISKASPAGGAMDFIALHTALALRAAEGACSRGCVQLTFFVSLGYYACSAGRFSDVHVVNLFGESVVTIF